MGIMQLAEQALSEIESISAEDAVARKDSGELVFVDVRDIREVEKSDTITGSHHAPRGMIEFWFDPESPYYRDIYGEKDKTYVLFCNGNPRSALSAKALKDMGIANVAQLEGGSRPGAMPVARPKKITEITRPCCLHRPRPSRAEKLQRRPDRGGAGRASRERA